MAKFKVEIERPLCISIVSIPALNSGKWQMMASSFKGFKKVGNNEEREMECRKLPGIHVYENGKNRLSHLFKMKMVRDLREFV